MNRHALSNVFCVSAIPLFACLSASLSQSVFDNAWIKGETAKNPLEYAIDEEMVFTLTLEGVAGAIPPDQFYIRWERSGDDGVRDCGTEPASTNALVLKTRLSCPGFVWYYAELVNSSNEVLRRKTTDDPSKAADVARTTNQFERKTDKIFFSGGAGADVTHLAIVDEPADFDAFWEKQKQRLSIIPMQVERKELPPLDGGETLLYAVEIACQGVRPVTGYLTIPKEAESGKKFPCRLETHGYRFSPPHLPPDKGRTGEIVLNINAHGIRLPAFGADEGYYLALSYEIRSNGYGYGFDPTQNSFPEGAYYNGMVLRVMRALEYLQSLSEWNGKDLYASGGSQGGLQTIWAAALDHHVTRAEVSVPWGCDWGGSIYKRNHGPWFVPYVRKLGYYDAVFFARRIPKTCFFNIRRAGLGDYTCPPSGIALLWNNLNCPRSIHWIQGADHAYVPPKGYYLRDINYVRGDLAISPKADPNNWRIIASGLSSGETYRFSTSGIEVSPDNVQDVEVVLYEAATKTFVSRKRICVQDVKNQTPFQWFFFIPEEHGDYRLLVYAGTVGHCAGIGAIYHDISVEKADRANPSILPSS